MTLRPDHTYTWLVSLATEFQGVTQHFCGGSLIRANVVLTAAHCVVEEGEFFVYAKRLEQSVPFEEEGSLKMTVKQIFIHPNFTVNDDMDEVYMWEWGRRRRNNPTTSQSNLP